MSDTDDMVDVPGLQNVRSWVALFGATDGAALEGFDLVVAGGTSRSGRTVLRSGQVRSLQERGILVLAHVPLVRLPRSREGVVPPHWLLRPLDPEAPFLLVDPARAGWRATIVRTAAAVASRGYDGLYLDDLDVGVACPGTRPALASLVRSVRGVVPRLLLLGQAVPEPRLQDELHGLGSDAPLLGRDTA